MIKILRIITIAAMILAAVLLILSVVYSIRRYEFTEAPLNSPSIIEKFNKTADDKTTRSDNETSPLVQQAGAFALYLDPPKSRVPSTPGRSDTIARGPAVTPKFKVIGTSYYEGRPEMSLVLIDEPGKGLSWIRQAGQIGHLSVEQIKDGLIVVNDNGRTYEIAAEQPPETSLLEGAPAVRKPVEASVQAEGRISSDSRTPSSGKGISGRAKAVSETPKRRMSTEQEQRLNEIVERLKELQRNNSSKDDKEKAAEMEILFNKLISSQLSPEEAQLSPEEARKLSDLGRELGEDIWKKPDESLPAEDGGK